MPEQEPYVYQAWPSWATGPNGEREIFNSEAEVPKGWKHHDDDNLAAPPKNPTKAPPQPVDVQKAAAEAQQSGGAIEGSEGAPQPADVQQKPENELDAAGVAFDPSRHAATKTKTSKGLWRMKVGVNRPADEGVIKPLDL